METRKDYGRLDRKAFFFIINFTVPGDENIVYAYIRE